MLARKAMIVVRCDQCAEEIIVAEGGFVPGTLLAGWYHLTRHSPAVHDPGDERDFCSLGCLLARASNECEKLFPDSEPAP